MERPRQPDRGRQAHHAVVLSARRGGRDTCLHARSISTNGKKIVKNRSGEQDDVVVA